MNESNQGETKYIDTSISERLILQDAKIEALENQIKGLISSKDFMGIEGRLEQKLSQMKLEMHKKEDRISEVSAEFARVRDHVDTLKDLKVNFKRYENNFKNIYGILTHDLENLKTAFELLRITSSSSTYKSIYR